MTGSLINRSRSRGGGNGHVFKVTVPLKSRLRSFSKKSAQSKHKKSEFLESRSPSHTSAYTTECTREEPEEVFLHTPTARRLNDSSWQLTPFDTRRKHRIMSFSRNSSSKRQTQIRSPHQSKKCMKNLSPALSGSGATMNSPWATPSVAQVYYPPGAQCYHYPTTIITNDDRMDIVQTVSSDEHDLPHAISPAYKFVTIEMAERMEAVEALEHSSFSSSDYDICSDEYMSSHQEALTNTTKKSQKKDKKKQQKGHYNQDVDKYSMHVDKYAMHESHSPFNFGDYASNCNMNMWTSLQEGIIYSQCCHGQEID